MTSKELQVADVGDAVSDDDLLEQIGQAAWHAAALDAAAKDAFAKRDALVRAMFARYQGRRAPVNRIVEKAGLGRERLYQIRDGR